MKVSWIGCVVLWLVALLVPVAVRAADPLAELKAGLASNDPDRRMEAVAGVADLGPFAAPLTPELSRLLATDDLALKVDVITALGEIGEGAAEAVPQLRQLTNAKEILVRHAVWTALRAMAPASRTAAPDLDSGMADPELVVRMAAAQTAIVFDPGTGPQRIITALKVLAEGLKSDSAELCHEAAQSLTMVGPLGVPVLVDAVRSGNPAAQIAALDALARLGADASPAIATVVALKPAEKGTIAAAQARTLAAIVPDAKQAVPVLTALTSHATPSARVASLHALGMYPQAAEATVPVIVKGLKDPEVSVRLAAVEALAAIGPAAKAGVPALDAALADQYGSVTVRAAEAMAMIGPDALPALIKRLDDPNYGLLALQTISQMGPRAKSAAPQLVAKLAQPGTLPVREVCIALAFLEADAAVAGPALQKIAQDRESPARPAAIFALGKIGDKSALKLITNAVEDKNVTVRLASAWALLQLDPKNPDYIAIAVPRLAVGLERPDPRVRKLAAETLASLGPAAAAAVPALTKRVGEDEDPVVRMNCALAIGQMGEASRTAVPALVKLLESDPAGRRAVLFALGNLGPVATEALPVLRREALQGPLFDRTLAAWAALKVKANPQQIDQLVPVLITRLTREQPEAIVQMVQLLSQLQHGRDEIDKFLNAIKDSPDPRIREAVQTALKSPPKK
ncbi:MAG TPA: HEAT repeat domain-containing protein [Planctomycetaceae bacterium]|nr:HEAT repeat domain-containing protein [Planctomycetaceae bacterium]